MRNVAVHFIDALQWWFGPVESVFADRETMFSEVRKPIQIGRSKQRLKNLRQRRTTRLSRC